jgi:NNMT/PNMT/TEMT family
MPHETHSTYQLQSALTTETFVPFDPRSYLKEYYSHLGEENRELLHFLDEAYERIFTHLDMARVLEFGGGPTIYQLISAAKYPVSIDFSDYLDANLSEVQMWLQDRPEKFYWDSFIRYVLYREGERSDRDTIENRSQLIRRKVNYLIHCDAKKIHPLGSQRRAPYDIMSVNFVLESITTEMDEWNLLLDNVEPLVKTQGYLLMSAIIGATHYRVGELFFPAVPISPETIEAKLKQKHFSIVSTRCIGAEHREKQGYDGIFMVLARKGEA